MLILFARRLTRRRKLMLSGVIAGALVVAQTASAQPLDVITLAEALARTIADSPELAALGYQTEAAQGRLQQAALAPNPELNVQVHDVLGTDDFRGAESAETTVTLGWILERGLRERRIDAARAEVSLRAADVEIARLDTAAETARRFLACLAHQERLQSARNSVAMAEETVAAVRRRVAVSLAPQAELERAEVDLARAELLEEDIEHELLSAYHRLSAQWGATEPNFEAVAGALDAVPTAEPFAALFARIEQNPELGRFMSERRLDEAALRLAQAQRKPSWTLATGVRRFEGTADQALVAGITVPLAVRNRNQGRIAEAEADLAHTSAAANAARVQIETTLFVLYQQFQHSLHVVDRLRDDVIPRIERALAETRRAYELGRYGYLEWRTVQAELLDAQNDLLEASADAHGWMIELERLTGMPIAGPGAARGGRDER